MSRSNTPFSDAGGDAFLPSIELDDEYAGYGHFFGDDDVPVFPSPVLDNDALNDLGLGLHEATIAPANSRTASGTATPNYEDVSTPGVDFDGYEFEQHRQATHVYPSPNGLDGSTHPYPLQAQQQQASHHNNGKRPMPYRSTTNAHVGDAPSALQNFSRAHLPPHRRSWSQNDTERLAHLDPHQHLHHPQHRPPYHSYHSYVHEQPAANPTFFRLCETRAPRAVPSPKSDFKKPAPRTANRGRTSHPGSIPVGIGTPLGSTRRVVPAAGNMQLTGPKMVHMSHAEQRKTSQWVIEIGAMSVLDTAAAKGRMVRKERYASVDPLLLEERAKRSDAPSPDTLIGGSNNSRDRMLQDLKRMEQLLSEGAGEEKNNALKACEVIREALAKMEDRGGGTKERQSQDDEAPATNGNIPTLSTASSNKDSPLSEEDGELFGVLVGNSPSPS